MPTTKENWDLSQERAFVENLLSQRFNFFLIMFSLVIAGAVNANTKFELVAILSIGLLLCVLVGFTVGNCCIAHTSRNQESSSKSD